MNGNDIAVTGKRLAAAALTLFFLFAFLQPAYAAVAVPEYKDEYGYVADFADVIKGDTINYINEANVALTEACGAEIIVVTVDFLGGAEIEDYAYSLFNEWQIGSAEKDNGVLLLLVIGEENYYALQGAGLEKQFSSSMLDEYLYDFLEEDFAAGDYDAGVRKFFNASLERLERIYGVTLQGNASQPGSTGSTGSTGANDRGSSGYTPPNPAYQPPVYRSGPRINWALIIVIVIIIAFYLFSRRPRYPRTYGHRPYMGGGRTIFRPIIFGGRRSFHYRPPVGMPPPRPVRSPGTKGGPKPPAGGSSGGSGSSGGGFGGFSGRTGGGGSSRGGGAGRSSGGFGGFGGFGGLGGGSKPSSGSSGRSSGSFGGGRSSGGFGGFGGGGRSSGGFGGGRSGGGGSSRGGGAGRR